MFLWGKNFLKKVFSPHPFFKNFYAGNTEPVGYGFEVIF